MKKTLLALAVAASAATVPAAAQDAGQINVICSVQAEWCNLMQTVYSRTTGVKVNMSLKGVGADPNLSHLADRILSQGGSRL